MPPATLHNLDRNMADLRQILSQGRKRIGILIGAGAPTAIGHGEQNADDVRVDSGAAVFFADGLRLDVCQRLVERLESKGRSVEISTRWAAHPTVTATAKPAVSPVSEHFGDASLGADCQLVTVEADRPLSTDRFRKLLDASGYQYLSADETGGPSPPSPLPGGEGGNLRSRLDGVWRPRQARPLAASEADSAH